MKIFLRPTKLTYAITACLFMPWLHTAYAADNQSVLSASNVAQVDPGSVANQLSQRKPHYFKKTPLEELEAKPIQSPKMPGAEKIFFELKGVDITGNTAFSSAKLLNLFKPYINKKVSLATILELNEKITKLYHQKGYLLSRAILPPQKITNGIVHIQIIEGHINSVKVEGIKDKKPKAYLEHYAYGLTQDKPLDYHELERKILLINDIPGINARAIVAPNPTLPQASDLTLASQYTPARASLTYDNFGSRYFGPNEVTLNTALNSIFSPGGTLYTRAVMSSRTQELQYFDARHDQLIGTNGLRFGVGGSYADTNPDFTLQPLDVQGNSKSLFTDLTYPFIRSQKQNLYGRVTLNYLNSSMSSFGTPIYFDRTRTASLEGDYDNVKWKGVNQASLKLSQGFNILGANNNGTLRSRAQGVSDYTTLNLTLARNQYLTDRLSVYGMVTSQYTHDPLLAAQEITFGGGYLGRGFEPAQFSGDKGVLGTLELRLNTEPNFKVFKQVQYYAFCDSGTVWNLDQTANPQKQSATSAGIGAKMKMLSHLDGNFFIAKPLTQQNNTLETLGRNSKSATAYFQFVTYI